MVATFIRYNVYLSREQLQALHQIYDEDGTRVSEQIRRALDTWLMKKGRLAETTRIPFKPVEPPGRRRSGRSKR